MWNLPPAGAGDLESNRQDEFIYIVKYTYAHVYIAI